MRKSVIKNSRGEAVRLFGREEKMANHLQRMVNSFGYEVQITTLTEICKLISEQKFFELAPADYVPVIVGQGAWSSNIVTYRSFDVADSFESGLINVGGESSRLASADAGVDSLTQRVFNWAKEITWAIPELEEASRSGNWDLVAAKEESRKKNWDLGVQHTAFLGLNGQNGSTGAAYGLLNQPSVNVNSTTITQPISAMSTAQLKAFTAALIEQYRANCNRTAWPTHFLIPESDYNGLASQASPDFPIKSTLELLEEAFKLITRKPEFKILPCAYADAAYHLDVPSIVGKQVYALYNYDEKSIKMQCPVPYTNTLANSLNNFQFQNAAYGQITGVLAVRPLEALYFQY